MKRIIIFYNRRRRAPISIFPPIKFFLYDEFTLINRLFSFNYDFRDSPQFLTYNRVAVVEFLELINQCGPLSPISNRTPKLGLTDPTRVFNLILVS